MTGLDCLCRLAGVSIESKHDGYLDKGLVCGCAYLKHDVGRMQLFQEWYCARETNAK